MSERYWEDVEEGGEIPGFSLLLDELRFALQASGTQDFHLEHVDESYVQRQGWEHRFTNNWFTAAAFSRALTDWAGEDGFVKSFTMEMRRMNCPGDTMSVRGRVTRKYLADDEGLADLDIWVENDRVGVTVPGKATVCLPRRDAS